MDASVEDPVSRVQRDAAIRFGASSAPDPQQAIAEIHQAIWQPDIAFVVIFSSPEHDRTRLAEALRLSFADIPVIGCTTAGELTPCGYAEGAITAISFPARHFTMTCRLIETLSAKGIAECSDIARNLAAGFPAPEGWRSLALQFADGMSLQEDALVAALDAGLAPIPLYGGSAGDGMCFQETFVFTDGAFHSDAALLILINTDYNFAEVAFDHFTPTQKQMVVTDALPSERIVCEINGEPAAEEYARIIGHPVDKLGPFLFASFPTLVRAGGRHHVRSIQSVMNGTCLKFLSAIDVGIVLTIGEALEITDEMDKVFASLAEVRGRPEMVLGFDCILRKIEIVTLGKKDQISRILTENNVIGFSTYGEQHNGMHVNQTFVGVAFYPPGDGADQ